MKKQQTPILLIFLSFLFIFCQSTPKKPLQKIAFGSCSDQKLPQNYWQEILKTEPELWIWLGDIIYMDTYDMAEMQKTYQDFKQTPDYQDFIKKTPLIGIWDDHDYGLNDGGKEYSKRKESRDLLLDFLDIPSASPIRQREGAYGSYVYGEGEQQVKVILLDCRYFRDSLTYANDGVNRYKIGTEGDILGEEQWAWLEKELSESPANLHLIGSGIQFIPDEQGFEKWANLPKAQKRLFDLLQRVKPKNTVLLSGDRHIAEFSKIDLPALPYPLYEITASGLTHTWDKEREEPNRFRVGKVMISKNYALMYIDWEKPNPTVKIEVRNMQNHILETLKITFSR